MPSSMDPGHMVQKPQVKAGIPKTKKWKFKEEEKLDKGTQQVVSGMLLINRFLRTHSWIIPSPLTYFLRESNLVHLLAAVNKLGCLLWD